MVLCREAGLTASDRRDLTEYITGVEGGSMRDLTAADAGRVLDALAGYAAVSYLLGSDRS